MEVKDILKNRRLELHMTMKELADKVGVSEGTISRWESGDIENMRRDKISVLASALQMSPAVIMGWEEKPAASYYMDEETAALAQEMFEDPDMRSLFHMKRNMDPERVKTHMDFIKTLYKQEHPDDDDTGC